MNSKLLYDNLDDLLDEEEPINSTIRRASRLVGPKTGIIKEVRSIELNEDDPAVYCVVAEPNDLQQLTGKKTLNRGSGTSLSIDRATIKAIGESVERYCAAQYSPSDLELSTFDDLPDLHYRAEDFALYTDPQYLEKDFPYKRLENNTKINFIEGWNLTRSCLTKVPATMVYVPYDASANNEPVIWDNISTGLACHTNLWAAIYNGIMECIERDSFMLSWLLKASGTEIQKVEIVKWQSIEMIRRMEEVGLTTNLFRIDFELGIPVILTVCQSVSGLGYPKLVVGLGTDVDIERAIFSSIEEVCLGACGMRRTAEKDKNFVAEADYSNITTLEKHGLIYAINTALSTNLDFLYGPKFLTRNEMHTSGSKKSAVKSIIKSLSKLGHETMFVDLTTDDISEVGLHVIRVVIPGLLHLHNNHRTPYLGGTRLKHWLDKMQEQDPNSDIGLLNSVPHPFP